MTAISTRLRSPSLSVSGEISSPRSSICGSKFPSNSSDYGNDIDDRDDIMSSFSSGRYAVSISFFTPSDP